VGAQLALCCPVRRRRDLWHNMKHLEHEEEVKHVCGRAASTNSWFEVREDNGNKLKPIVWEIISYEQRRVTANTY
jgi:hypothetical protein